MVQYRSLLKTYIELHLVDLKLAKYGQEILYITERGVFSLSKTEITLEEFAPGIDLDKDIISKMCFMPKMNSIKKMDERIFKKAKMGIREDLMHI